MLYKRCGQTDRPTHCHTSRDPMTLFAGGSITKADSKIYRQLLYMYLFLNNNLLGSNGW